MAIVISRPTIGSAERKPKPHADRTEDDGEAGQAVGPGMIAVGNQGRAADFAADPDPEHGDRLVADESDEACRGHTAETA